VIGLAMAMGLCVGSCVTGFGFGCLAMWQPSAEYSPVRREPPPAVPSPLPVAAQFTTPDLTLSEIAAYGDKIGAEIDGWWTP
jgi:hypothetical protein